MLSPSSYFISTYMRLNKLYPLAFVGPALSLLTDILPGQIGLNLGNCSGPVIGGKLCTSKVAADDWVTLKGPEVSGCNTT